MHKSGTSLISQTLLKSGVFMGDFDLSKSYDQGNQYEMKEALEINFDILKAKGIHSLDLSPNTVSECSIEHELKIETLIEKLNEKYENWGIKEPRMCINYPIWERYLPEHVIIHIYRNPYELIKHYGTKRSVKRIKTLKVWAQYNENILKYCQGKKHICISFENFIQHKDSLKKLSNFLNIELSDCRKNTLYRSRAVRKIPIIDRFAKTKDGFTVFQTLEKLRQKDALN